MSEQKRIEVRAAHSQQAVLEHQCVVVEAYDTIGEAKRRAKYFLTDDYQRIIESSEPLRYAQVVVNDSCLYDFFRKGYNGQD